MTNSNYSLTLDQWVLLRKQTDFMEMKTGNNFA